MEASKQGTLSELAGEVAKMGTDLHFTVQLFLNPASGKGGDKPNISQPHSTNTLDAIIGNLQETINTLVKIKELLQKQVFNKIK